MVYQPPSSRYFMWTNTTPTVAEIQNSPAVGSSRTWSRAAWTQRQGSVPLRAAGAGHCSPCVPAHVRQRALPHAPTGHLCRLQTQTTKDSGSLKDQPTPPDPDRGLGSKGKEPITWAQGTENFGISGQFRRNQRTDLSVLASGQEKNQRELEVSKLLRASSPREKAFGEQTRHFRFS